MGQHHSRRGLRHPAKQDLLANDRNATIAALIDHLRSSLRLGYTCYFKDDTSTRRRFLRLEYRVD